MSIKSTLFLLKQHSPERLCETFLVFMVICSSLKLFNVTVTGQLPSTIFLLSVVRVTLRGGGNVLFVYKACSFQMLLSSFCGFISHNTLAVYH